jgi:hypothetical protein
MASPYDTGGGCNLPFELDIGEQVQIAVASGCVRRVERQGCSASHHHANVGDVNL